MSARPDSSHRRTDSRSAVAVAGFGGLCLAAVIARALAPAGTPRIRPRGGTDAAKSIATLEPVRIGGSEQWILERSEDVENPIVLYLHGGPGTSQLTLNRRNTRQLERYFNVVNWDQRGAGKSHGAIRDVEKMNIAQFVEDTRELSLYLLEKFDKRRLVLVGHSWGSVIGALTASKYPELFHCYVGIGQVANMDVAEAVSYRWTLEQARQHEDQRAIAALMRIGPPPYAGNWQKAFLTQRRLLGRYGGEIHGSRNGAFGLVFRNLLFSREYTLTDRINFFRGIFGSLQLLGPQLLEVDLFQSVREIAVPVFLIEGRHDHEAPSEIAERYFDSLKAPSKQLIWFERSAHMPNSEERDLFNRFMLEKVLPIAAGDQMDAGVAERLAET